MIRIRLHHVEAAAPQRAPGYLAAVRAAGRVDDGWVELEDDDYRSIADRFRLRTVPQVASVVRAGARWLAAGLPMADEDLLWQRSAVCAMCPAWHARERRCLECGCTGIKHWLASESCPLGRW